MMLIPAPSSSRIISGILLSAAVLRHSVLAGSGAVYGKGIISSAFVEFNGEVIRRGSEAFFEITTGDDAEVPDVTCESPWMRLRAFNGRMDGTGKQIRPIEYKFIPRPGDNASLEKFTLCLAEATGLPRSFEAEFNEDGIRLRVGRAIRKGNRKERFTPWFGEIPLSGHYRIAVDEQATETGGDNGSLRGPSSACEACFGRLSLRYKDGGVATCSVELKDEVIGEGSEARFTLTASDEAVKPFGSCQSPWMRVKTVQGKTVGHGVTARVIFPCACGGGLMNVTNCRYLNQPRPFGNTSRDSTWMMPFPGFVILARSIIRLRARRVRHGCCLQGDVRLGTGTLIYKFIARPGDSTEFEAYTRCLVNATALPAFFTAELIDDANPRVKVKVGQLPNKGKRLVTGLAPEVRLSIENLVDKRRPLVEAEGVDGNEGSRAQQTDEVDGRRSNEGSHGQQTDEVDGRPLNDEGRGQLTGIGGRKMRKYVRVRPTEAPSLNGKSSGKSGKTKNGGRPSDCDRQRKHKKRSGCIIL